MSGWGCFLEGAMGRPVHNYAVPGASTESFVAEGHWARLLNDLVPADAVVIQFGHNDQKHPELLGPRGGYTRRLEAMVSEVQAEGAVAVLCTPAERRHWREGRVHPSHGDYPNAVRDLAASRAVPLIDLTAFTTWLYEDLGEHRSARLVCHLPPGRYPRWPAGLEDDTHFRRRGARKIAAFVAKSLRAIERLDGQFEPMGPELERKQQLTDAAFMAATDTPNHRNPER